MLYLKLGLFLRGRTRKEGDDGRKGKVKGMRCERRWMVGFGKILTWCSL